MSLNVNSCANPLAEPTTLKQIAKDVADAWARPLLLSLSDCPSLASSIASLLLAMALVPVATTDGAEPVPMATDGEPAQAGADAAPVSGEAGVTAFDVYMPQFDPDAFPPSRRRMCLWI